MSEIADFLRARYIEAKGRQQRIFRDTYEPGATCPICTRPTWGMRMYGGDEHRLASFEPCGHDTNDPAVVARFQEPAPDPDVVADLDAKLALIDEIEVPLDDDLEPATDAELHALESHPAWEYRTTMGPRKQWDDIDVPPCDREGEPEPGWERNVDAGRDGWERFDYTEESYWRRPRLGGPRKAYIERSLRILAQPFAGHPDHKGEEWAP